MTDGDGPAPPEDTGPSGLEAAQAVLASLVDPYVLSALDGRVLGANRPARELLSGIPMELPGSIHEWAAPGDPVDGLLERWAGSSAPRPAAFGLRSGRRVRGDGARVAGRPWLLIRLRDKDRSNAAFASVATRLRSEHLHVLSQRLDATVAQLHAANRRLHAANEELQQYAGAVAHDVRTPLFTIRGFAQMIEEGGHVDDRGRELIALILESAERLHQTTESLLAVARLDQQPDAVETVEVATALKQALDDQRRELDASHATITDELDGLHVAVPHVALRQVFQNLVANSLRFRDPARAPHIEVRARRVGDLVEISVRDNGVGIDDADREHLFDLFQRGARRVSTPGHGIGLATCRKLVNRWGGSIRCVPVSGHGAGFVFTAPSEPAAGSPPGLV